MALIHSLNAALQETYCTYCSHSLSLMPQPGDCCLTWPGLCLEFDGYLIQTSVNKELVSHDSLAGTLQMETKPSFVLLSFWQQF